MTGSEAALTTGRNRDVTGCAVSRAESDPPMTDPEARPYVIERRETVARTDTLRVGILTLAEGQEVPWHYHSEVTDTFYCLEGVLSVETRAPRAQHLLKVGESCAVPEMTAHRVTGQDGCRARFLIVQGIGTYDFCPVG